MRVRYSSRYVLLLFETLSMGLQHKINIHNVLYLFRALDEAMHTL
mgnify:CR=1 FL=1